jgi:hypothetical protein
LKGDAEARAVRTAEAEGAPLFQSLGRATRDRAIGGWPDRGASAVQRAGSCLTRAAPTRSDALQAVRRRSNQQHCAHLSWCLGRRSGQVTTENGDYQKQRASA